MVKECELCGVAARLYCESDQASLCWDCDEKVHSANFLVAKHSRTLLCHVCHSQTPWKASGSKLGPTVSICHSCFTSSVHNGEDEEVESRGESDDNSYEDDDDDDGDESTDQEEDEEEEEEEEEGENQVVPWSAVASPSPPVASSSSSGGEISSGVGLKRSRDGFDDDSRRDLDSDDEPAGSYTSQLETGRLNNELARSSMVSDAIIPALRNSAVSIGKRKQSRMESEREDNNGQVGSGSGESSGAMIIETFKRLQQRETVSGGEGASATILGICRLSRHQSLRFCCH